MTMLPPHIRDQLGHLASQDGPTVREMYEQRRQRDLEEQERQQRQRDLEEQDQQQRQRDLEEQDRQRQQLSRRRDYYRTSRQARQPAGVRPSGELTMRDVANYEKASELYELRDMARQASQQDRLVQKIEGLMNRDFDAYAGSVWPEVYSRLTGADKDAESRK
jgi:hypothetical protein